MREARSISVDWCLPDGKLYHQRATEPSSLVDECVWLRMSLIWTYLDNLRYKRRGRWGPTDVWYVVVLLHIEFSSLLLPSVPLFGLPLSVGLSVLVSVFSVSSIAGNATRWGIGIRTTKPWINRKSDIPPGLIMRNFSLVIPWNWFGYLKPPQRFMSMLVMLVFSSRILRISQSRIW